MPLSIVSFNVNGLAAWKGSVELALSPTSAFQTETDNAIICLQEVKASREKLVKEGFAHIHDYFAFHSCAKRASYSGVSTVVPKYSECVPVYSQAGFLNGSTTHDLSTISNSDMKRAITTLLCEFEMRLLQLFDDEGRLAISDHRLFVMLNAYFPRACADEGTRYAYKLKFQDCISFFIRILVDVCKREVILVGDMNICHTPLDHCDPSNHVRENKLDAFGDTDSRKWLDLLLGVGSNDGGQPKGLLVDLFRAFWPAREGAYTCWNTLIDARRANFGTRIDYILVTPSLIPWFSACDILPDIHGSDHCPVIANFLDKHPTLNISLSEALRPLNSDFIENQVPIGCAELWEECGASKRQTSLRDWFSKGKEKVTADGATEHSEPLSLKRKRALSSQTSISSFFGKRDVVSSDGDGPRKKNATDVDVSGSWSIQELIEKSTSAVGEKDSSDTSRENAVALWKNLLKRPEIPRCYHGEETKEFRVNKQGPNQGRYFYLCARPVGPSDAKPVSVEHLGTIPRRTVTEFRCNYFQWKKGK